jgi:regulator of sirC expression with transglutaminase-like and TPR domain
VLGRTEESIQSLNRAIELDPEDPETWLMKGYILQGMKKPDDALKCFETAWKLIPTTVEVSKVRTKGKKTVRASKKGKKARNTSKTKKNKR